MSERPLRLTGARGARLRTLAVVALGLLMVPVAMLQVARASESRWSEPVQVSMPVSGMKDWFPALAADDTGGVHIVWNSALVLDSLDLRGWLNYARWDGRTWSVPNDIAVDWGGAALRSSIVADAAGRLHMVYLGYGSQAANPRVSSVSDPQDLWYTSAPGTDAESIHAWQTPVRVTQSQQGYYSSIAVDSKGVLHVIWTESVAGSWGIFYTHSVDGGSTWSPRQPLEDSQPVWWYRAHLQVDGQDRLHVVWERLSSKQFGTTVGAVYAQSADGGLSWTKTVFSGPPPRGASNSDATPGPGPQQPAVGIDGGGNILFVYREPGTDRILFRESADGRSWAAPKPIPGVTAGVARPYDVYNMATDSAGHVHLVAVGYPLGSVEMAVLHSEWDGQAWGSPEVVASAPPYPEYPGIALSNGNRLHVVWFESDKAVVGTPVGIWYSAASTSAPAAARRGAVPRPSPAIATPVPTVVPLRAGVQLPPPPPGIGEVQPSQLPGWAEALRGQQQLPLLLSFVPVFAVLGATVAVKLGWLGLPAERKRKS